MHWWLVCAPLLRYILDQLLDIVMLISIPYALCAHIHTGTATSAPGQAYEASATYQRVMTLLSPEQLQLVLAKGWEALDHSPVFSTDAGMQRAAYSCSSLSVHL